MTEINENPNVPSEVPLLTYNKNNFGIEGNPKPDLYKLTASVDFVIYKKGNEFFLFPISSTNLLITNKMIENIQTTRQLNLNTTPKIIENLKVINDTPRIDIRTNIGLEGKNMIKIGNGTNPSISKDILNLFYPSTPEQPSSEELSPEQQQPLTGGKTIKKYKKNNKSRRR
jgi:hypothetical protein